MCQYSLNNHVSRELYSEITDTNLSLQERIPVMACELNKIFLGEVASVQNYGAFIKIPGCSQQGLVHRTQISTANVDNVTEVLERGDKIWCKIISVNDDGKVGLSMKYVNQKNGEDLDENGAQLQMEQQRKKTVSHTQRKAIQLEAVYNTTCSRCGTRGHLASNCFTSPDGKKYELIPEIEEEKVPEEIPEEVKDKKVSKKHKEKKSKKKKKAKKVKQNEDSSDKDEDESLKKKKKKKHSSERKRKKKRSDSDTDSTSSSDNVSGKATKRKYSEEKDTRTKKCKYSKTKHPD